MARLPQPIMESIEASWPKNYKKKQKEANKLLGQLMRIKSAEDKRRENEKKKE